MSVTVLDNTSGGTTALTGGSLGLTTTTLRGYTFTTDGSSTWEISGLRLGLAANTTPGNYSITIGLHVTDSGEPTGSALAAVTLSVSLTTTAGYFLFDEATLDALADYTMAAGTSYALIVTGDVGARWSYPAAAGTAPTAQNGFTYGDVWSSTDGGDTWTNPTNRPTIELFAEATCFLRGTRILTDRDEVAVETLSAGDRVATRFGGLRAIRWIGTQRFDGRLAGRDHQPVRFRAGALGGGLPHSDLLVSPGHAMLVGEVLAHAGALVNDVTIVQERMAGEIAYFHLDLGPHDCVLANGAWAETYFEDRNRDTFHNAAEFHTQFPAHEAERQETCLPIVVAGDARLPALHARLAPRLGAAALTADPDLHLLADGRRVALEAVGEGVWQAVLPAGLRSLRLRSRTARPTMVFDATDPRALGVMVYGIEADGVAIGPEDAALGQGWHAAERDGALAWRWTDGDAAIPVHLLGGATRITLRGWCLPRYVGDAMAEQVAA